MAEMHQRFQQELMSNPEAMRQVLDSPFVQQVMNSPDIIRTMLSANPQIQQLMEVYYSDVYAVSSFLVFRHLTIELDGN